MDAEGAAACPGKDGTATMTNATGKRKFRRPDMPTSLSWMRRHRVWAMLEALSDIHQMACFQSQV